ncbi:hypothetical protein [Rhizorhabdus sp. FW153]
MSEEEIQNSEPTVPLANWGAPELRVIELSDLTEQFNGGAGDANTGS